ncbi:MAG: hypothetical protein K2J24_01370 [Muribaculaceae bacterium]|nr:hypothetical protein [Bacteroides sp.]MDE6842154.1 hypothetical protein [Muribaculaceae bacterium]
MKTLVSIVASLAILVATLVSAPAAQAAPAPAQPSGQQSLSALIPASIVVEQTVTLDDGRNITVYYQKNGDRCEVYSESDLSGYNINDLAALQSTSFRIVSGVRGKCVYSTSFAQARKLFKQLVNQYL